MLIIPFLLLILAIAQITVQTTTTGDFVNKGISLKGGSTITITKEINSFELQDYLQSQFPTADIAVREISSAGQTIAVAIDSDAQEEAEIQNLLDIIKEKTPFNKEDYTVEIIGAALGASFFKQTFIAIIVAFILMGFVVFLYFRSIAPSLAVILAAFSDIVITIAVFNLTGMKLSTAGIAALLMLIGYSVDTDILLSTRVLKRTEGTVMHRILSAMKTGLTMTTSTLVAVTLALIFAQSPILQQIMTILLIGLLVDLVNTWIQNVGIIRIYLERKHKKYHHEN